jgi:hypothetical protein
MCLLLLFQSFTGLDRITPTPEEFSPPRYIQHSAPHHHRRSHFDDYRQPPNPYVKRDRHAMEERIRIPSSNSGTSKSGSVEIGMLCS